MAHQEIGLATLRSIRDALSEVSKVEAEPKLMGKRMTMTLAPDRKPKTTKPGGLGIPTPGNHPGNHPGTSGTAGASTGAAGGLSPAPRPAGTVAQPSASTKV